MSMALAYIDPVRHRLNLTIRSNVQASRILLEDGPDGKRAVGVEVESGGETFVVEGGEIILCAGAVASLQLLMLSGVGPADQLGVQGIPVAFELPGVGQNMRDHLNVTVRFMNDVPLLTRTPRHRCRRHSCTRMRDDHDEQGQCHGRAPLRR